MSQQAKKGQQQQGGGAAAAKGKQPAGQQQQQKGKAPQGNKPQQSGSGNGQQQQKPKAAPAPSAAPASPAPTPQQQQQQQQQGGDAKSTSPRVPPATAAAGGPTGTGAGAKAGGGKKVKVEKETGAGIVKAVLSGDRIEVYVDDTTKRATWVPPQTKEMKFSNIKAPLPYAKGDWGVREEEPFAWASRNFLRDLCIGKRVTWTVDGKDARREYATVYLQGETRSLAEAIVEAGYATVSLPDTVAKEASKPAAASAEAEEGASEKRERRISESMQKLLAAQDDAKAHQRGRWTTAKEELAKAVPRTTSEFNTTDFYTREKGKKQRAIVEAVLSGSMLRVLLLPTYREIVVRIAGASAPATARRNQKKGEEANEGEAFAKEAQWTTERYTLHRQVHVTFTAFEPGKEADAKRAAVQAVFYAEVELGGKSVGELLLASGLAKFVDWTVPKDKHALYRNLESQAQSKKLRIWSSGETAASSSSSSSSGSRNFVGLVKEVPSGSTLVVLNTSVTPHQMVRVTMSSIDVPRLGVVEKADPKLKFHEGGKAAAEAARAALGDTVEYAEPFALEAREFVRKKLINRSVNVGLDYVKTARADEKNPNKALPEKAFYTVSYKGKNIALALVEHGLATVVEHFGQQQRSPHYDALFLAQQRSQKKKQGLHGPVQNKTYTNDVSRNPKKAKAVYPTVVRQGVERISGVVEYVIHGSRLKVSIPKDNLLITVTLAGARTDPIAPAKPPAAPGKDSAKKAADVSTSTTPSTATTTTTTTTPTPAPQKKKENKQEQIYAEEARRFTRDLVHHHDVELEVEGQDRMGAFRAHVWVKPRGAAQAVNVGVELLKEGLARGARVQRYEEEHAKAENAAKASRKRLWSNYDPEKEAAERQAAAAARDEAVVASGKPRKETVTVTEVIDGSTFFVQTVGDEQKRLEALMADVAAKGYADKPAYTPAVNEAVVAQFSGDNAWYRARVTRMLPAGAEDRKEAEVQLVYGDYGNAETVPVSRVRKLEAEHNTQALRWQAREASLAFVNPRPVDDEWGKEAALFFKDLVWDKPLLATVEYRESDCEYLSLWIADDYTFVNAVMLSEGLAKLPKRLPRGANREIVDYLRSAQDDAFRAHAGIWEYGDDGDDDEFGGY